MSERQDTRENAAEPRIVEFSFMPWAGLRNATRVGPVEFWPFWHLADQRVPDRHLREQLECYFKCYVDHRGKPVDSVTMCRLNEIDFFERDATDREIVRAAADALVFAALAPSIHGAVTANNRSMGPAGADKYQLITQRLRVGDDSIAVQAGKVHHGGLKIGQVTFPRPWEVAAGFDMPNTMLAEAFDSLFGACFCKAHRERLLRSLEWFRPAHTESDQVSPLSKVVMMATAFEVLLDVPNTSGKKRFIARKLEKKLARESSVAETRCRGGKQHTYTKIAWWGWDFYELRNRIVHGDSVSVDELRYAAPDRDWLTHLIVADLVLYEYVMWELYGSGCLDSTIGQLIGKCAAEFDKAFPGEAPAETYVARAWLGSDDMHRALGWLPADEEDKDVG